jgi:uncharacterized membrane protein YgdD (TMEM256/DUF423 family)
MCCSNYWLTIGAVMAGLAVCFGAFGAHGVDKYFAAKYKDAGSKNVAGFEVPTSWKRLEDFKTAADYQMYHALGLIAVGMLSKLRPKKSLQIAGWSFLLGIVLFSGSLYALTLTGEVRWGAIAPLGGSLLIVGWFALAMAACPCGSTQETEVDRA